MPFERCVFLNTVFATNLEKLVKVEGNYGQPNRRHPIFLGGKIGLI